MEVWLQKDKNDKGYRILSDQDILDAVTQGEPVEEWEEENEDEGETARVSHEGALECVDKLLDYMGQQAEFEFNGIIALRNIRQIVRKNINMAHKQRNITDFFQKKN